MINKNKTPESNGEKKNKLKNLAYRIGAYAHDYAGVGPVEVLGSLVHPQKEYDELKGYLFGTENLGYEPFVGKSSGPVFKNSDSIPEFSAVINNEGKYYIPEDDKWLFDLASGSGSNVYVNADIAHPSEPYRYDAANYPLRIHTDSGGNIVGSAADKYDFDLGYISRYPGAAKWQVKALSKLGNPYIVRQDNIPIEFVPDTAGQELLDKARKTREAINYAETRSTVAADKAEKNIIERAGYGYIEPAVKTDYWTDFASGGKIHIKPENRGKFTVLKERTGHSATWFKEHGTPAQKKMAVFALNSKHWNHKHSGGGFLGTDYTQGYLYPAPVIQDQEPTAKPVTIAPAPLDMDELKRRQYYIESKFNDKAKSKAGAIGAYQIMPITYKDYTQRTGRTGDLNDYAFNEEIRDYYMNRYLNSSWATKNDQSKYNTMAKALVGYNWGVNNLLKYLEAQKAAGIDIYGSTSWLDGVPPESKNYVKWILDKKDIGNRTTNAAYEKAKKRRFDFGGYVRDIIDRHGGDRETVMKAIQNVKAGRK